MKNAVVRVYGEERGCIDHLLPFSSPPLRSSRGRRDGETERKDKDANGDESATRTRERPSTRKGDKRILTFALYKTRACLRASTKRNEQRAVVALPYRP